MYFQLPSYRRILRLILYGLVCIKVGLATAGPSPANPTAGPAFSIIQLPDEQYQYRYPTTFNATIGWITNWATTNRVLLVLMPGDIVDNGLKESQWNYMTNQMAQLIRAGIPVLPSVGNHDQFGNGYTNLPSAQAQFNAHVGPLMAAQARFRNAIFQTNGDYANFALTVTNSGLKLLFLSLNANVQFAGAPYGVLPARAQYAWASNTAKRYPDHVGILVTHSYLNANGSISALQNDCYYLGGDLLWSNVVASAPNLFQVYCGHVVSTNWAPRSDLTPSGNVVDSLLFNLQTLPLGGGNFVRVYQWFPGQNTVELSTYNTASNAVAPSASGGTVFHFAISNRVTYLPQLTQNLLFNVPFSEGGAGVLHDLGPQHLSIRTTATNWALETYPNGFQTLAARVDSQGAAPLDFGTNLPHLGPCTLSLWHKFREPNNAPAWLISRFGSDTNGEWSLGYTALDYSASGALTNAILSLVWIDGGGSRHQLDSNPLSLDTNAWHQAAFAYDAGLGTLKLWLDGQLVAQTIGLTAFCGRNDTLHLVIGGNYEPQINAYIWPFAGAFGKTAVYGQSFGPQELAQVYQEEGLSYGYVPSVAHREPGLALPANLAGSRTIDVLTTLLVTNSASANSSGISYQLLNPPAGAAIDTNGVITWTPGQDQAPSTNLLTTVATDSGSPPLSATNSFVVVVDAPFSGIDLLDPQQAAADLDHDGLSNLMEYALGTDPRNPTDTHEALGVSVLEENGSQYLALSFRRRKTAPWLQYWPEVSNDAQIWSSDPSQVQITGVCALDDQFDWVTAQDWAPLSSPRFIRLRVVALTPSIAAQ